MRNLITRIITWFQWKRNGGWRRCYTGLAHTQMHDVRAGALHLVGAFHHFHREERRELGGARIPACGHRAGLAQQGSPGAPTPAPAGMLGSAFFSKPSEEPGTHTQEILCPRACRMF